MTKKEKVVHQYLNPYPYPIKPFFNRILLKRSLAEEKSKGGIILSAKSDPKHGAPCIGEVLEIGNTCDDFILELRGKKVMFSRFAGDWLKFPGIEEEYFICSDEDILGEIFC